MNFETDTQFIKILDVWNVLFEQQWQIPKTPQRHIFDPVKQYNSAQRRATKLEQSRLD